MPRILTEEELERHVTMEACLSALEEAFVELGYDRATTDVVRTHLVPVSDAPDDAVPPVYYGMRMMGGVVPAFGVAAVRINSDVFHWPTNEGTGGKVRKRLPLADGRYAGSVLAFDVENGEPLFVFPDGFVQAYRVGATSALGARSLAREDARVLGMLGAGQQAQSHLLAYDQVRPLETVRVFAPTPDSRDRYVAEMNERVDASVEPVDEAREVFRGPDIVQAATNALDPVFDPDWLEPGTHFGFIRGQEAPDEFFAPDATDVFAHSWPIITEVEVAGKHRFEREVLANSWRNYVVEGDQPLPRFADSDVGTEPVRDWRDVPRLPELLVEPDARSGADDVTVFYNRGMGIQFAAVAKVVRDVVERHGVGTSIPTETFTQEHVP